jgi:hypothetical protein
MQLFLLVVAMMAATGPVLGQEAPASSPDGEASTAGDTARPDLPVSVDRIRDALASPPGKPLLRGVGERADFSLTVEERVILEDFFKPSDFQTGPAPPGGLYAYEQQQVTSNRVDRPLAQPYAAFSGGELVTLAIQGLLFKYLGEEVTDRVIGARHAAEEAAARENVLQAIEAYCAAQPSGGAAVEICSGPPAP